MIRFTAQHQEENAKEMLSLKRCIYSVDGSSNPSCIVIYVIKDVGFSKSGFRVDTAFRNKAE